MGHAALRWGVLSVWILLLLMVVNAAGQIVAPGVPASGQETLTVSTTTLGVTAATCGPNNERGVLLYIITNGVYLALHSATAVAASTDFTLNAGDWFFVRPASKVRLIRSGSADSSVKVQCIE